MFDHIGNTGSLLERATELHHAGLPFQFCVNRLMVQVRAGNGSAEELNDGTVILFTKSVNLKCYQADPAIDWFCFEKLRGNTGAVVALNTAMKASA